MSLASKIGDTLINSSPRKPLWEGPAGKGKQGGVTQGLLGRYLTCKERFRVQYMEGLRPHDRFSHLFEFGNMWHKCEEHYFRPVNADQNWWAPLQAYCWQLVDRYPTAQDQIDHWFRYTKALFPEYALYWAEHPDTDVRVPLLQEEVFDVPYKLPSGRVVRLRGKWDGVDLVRSGGNAGIWLQENKTKSEIDRPALERQLTFDLQTMVYLIALSSGCPKDNTGDGDCGAHYCPFCGKGQHRQPLRGVRYNVVKRSTHKIIENMVKKVREDVAAGKPGEWFERFNVYVTPTDISEFKRTCLDPVLENLYDDWEWFSYCDSHSSAPAIGVFAYGHRERKFPLHTQCHFIKPYGIYDPIAEGGESDVDNFIRTGSTVGLTRVENLFPELQT